MESDLDRPELNELSLLFTDDNQIQALNLQYRGKDRATDVLSFPLLEGEEDAPARALGDIVISLDKAEEQASQLGVTLHDELFRLIIHGLLHLVGYDHENVPVEEAERMQRREDELFSLL